MSFEQLLIPVLSGIIGWATRHYGVIQPASVSPQSRPGAADTSSAGPAQADWRGEVRAFVAAEIKKAVAALATPLPPPTPALTSPQPTS